VSGPAETAPSDDRVGRRLAPARFASHYFADPKHGPLPALLLVLTIVTGLVDAASILALGRVFVANMTGNVAFIGFALAGAPGFSLAGSLSALIGFVIGALGGGAMITRMSAHRGRLLRETAAAEFVLFAVAVVIVVVAAPPLGPRWRRVSPRGRAGPAEHVGTPPRRAGPHDDGAHDDDHRNCRRHTAIELRGRHATAAVRDLHVRRRGR
jgi:Protein of unknown function (DUF1275)